MQVQIQSLNSTHDCKTFDCGEVALNNWLACMARQQHSRNIARTFVAVEVDAPTRILGFYALSVSEIEGATLPKPKKYPNLVPVVRLGRFAVNQQVQGKGLGGLLMLNALERIAEIAAQVGLAAVVVDAKHEAAARFYQRFGFIALPDKPLQLFLPTQTLLAAFAKNIG
jgi:predicted GNAT family N-acyltransferase